MKKYIALAILLCSSFIASATPLPTSRPYAMAQTGDNYQFNPIIRAQQTQPAPVPPPVATIANGTPIVVTAPPPGGLSDILSGIQAALMALIAGLLGFKKSTPATGGTVAATTTDVGTIVSSVVAKMSGGTTSMISDPAVRAAVDNALLQLERSGVPTTAINAAGGLIPGASPFISLLEPMVRNAVDRALSARVGTVDPTAPVSLPASIIGDLTAVLKTLAPKPA